MEFYIGIFQTFGIHILLGLSAYFLLQTGQISLAQAGFFGIGAFTAGIFTTIYYWHLVPALIAGGALAGFVSFLVGFPALRVKGMMLVIATLALSEGIRLFFFNFDFVVERDGTLVGPQGGEGFRQIRFFPENGWTTLEVSVFIVAIAVFIGAIMWWMDRSRIGIVFRAVGEDEVAAQSVGINLTAVKVAAMTIGGIVAGIGGGLYAHSLTHVEQANFNVLLSTFAIAYPIIGGLNSIFGVLFAVLFIQGFLVEGLRFMGDWRNLLFGLLIILVMNVRIKDLKVSQLATLLKGLTGRNKGAGHAGA